MGLTRREMNLRAFSGEALPHVFFQPRFEPWFDWHRQFGTLPGYLEGMSLPEVYDMLDASMRTVHYYTGQPDPVEVTYDDEVRIAQEEEGEWLKVRFDTPHGPLFEAHKFTVDRTWRRVEYPAKGADDLPALLWLVERRHFRLSAEKFEQGAAYIGERGVPQFWVPKSPYFALAQQWMKYEHFIYALADHRPMMERIMEAIDASYDELYQDLTAADRPQALQILNFGENVAMAYLSQRYYEQYVLPWYARRSGQLRDAGIYTHIHIDGYFRGLLPYLADMPFDGLEALTPEPQGDVTLEEMAAHMGDKVLLDGIPAVLFLEHYPREALQACVERIVELFHPRLVLGISDELPEGGGEESFERMRWVAEWCKRPALSEQAR